MAIKLRPPKGYRDEEHPLRHDFNYYGSLSADNTLAAQGGTICTLIRGGTDIDATPNTIETNPYHSSFEVEGGPFCAMHSIIPRMTIALSLSLTKGAWSTDKVMAINVYWMAIYGAFGEDWDAVDQKSTDTASAILEMTKDATNEDMVPLVNGTDLSNAGTQPLSTGTMDEVAADYNLTTDDKLEGVTFDLDKYFDCMSYYTNQGIVRKLSGKMHKVTITNQRPFRSIFMNKFLPPGVKRINPYTYLGILIHVPVAGTRGQLIDANTSTAVQHVNFNLTCRYNEWNTEYESAM